MSRGDAAHASEQQHGVQFRPQPPDPKTVESRLDALETRLSQIEATLVNLGEKIDDLQAQQPVLQEVPASIQGDQSEVIAPPATAPTIFTDGTANTDLGNE